MVNNSKKDIIRCWEMKKGEGKVVEKQIIARNKVKRAVNKHQLGKAPR